MPLAVSLNAALKGDKFSGSFGDVLSGEDAALVGSLEVLVCALGSTAGFGATSLVRFLDLEDGGGGETVDANLPANPTFSKFPWLRRD